MPRQSPNSGGWVHTGKIRIRTGWLGFAVIEELCEHIDETRLWRRVGTSWRVPEDVPTVPTTGSGVKRVEPGTFRSGLRSQPTGRKG